MPHTVPTYQPGTYPQMEGGPQVPAAPLAPQPVKRPLTISAPDDGAHPGREQQQQQQYQQQQQQQQYQMQYPAQPQAYQLPGGGYAYASEQPAYAGEALPQREPAGGARRYSAVARQ